MKKGSPEDGVMYHAGFPNAAEDQRAGGLSLDALLVRHRASTYFWRLDSDIPEYGWRANNLVIVDRSRSPHEGDVVVVALDDTFAVRGFRKKSQLPVLLRPDGTEDDTAQVLWGVVTYVIQEARV